MGRITIFLAVVCLVHCGCSRDKGGAVHSFAAGEAVKYASGFHMEAFPGYSILHVTDPWQGSEGIHLKYLVAGENAQIPDSLTGFARIDSPVQRLICMSTTHIAMIRALGVTESIVGISGREYINDTVLLSRIEEGHVKDVGAGQGLNYELIVSLQPDVLVAYGITGEVNSMVSRLGELGIPVILNADYLENHPLGKLEWIRFMSALYDEEARADSIFRHAEQAYRFIRDISSTADSGPAVMTGLPWKGSWYIPGGKSFAAAYIRDAGGTYVWEDAPNREALPLSMESVFEKAGTSDIWINCGSALTLAEIERTDPRLAAFRPFQNGRVFNNTARLNQTGGNDYWESGVMNPHLILADLVHIFHPELLPEHRLVYYERLK